MNGWRRVSVRDGSSLRNGWAEEEVEAFERLGLLEVRATNTLARSRSLLTRDPAFDLTLVIEA